MASVSVLPRLRDGTTADKKASLNKSKFMSKFYNIPRSAEWNYDPKRRNYFTLSRGKLDLFLECPRCFYLDNRLGLKRPEGFPFNLNRAVDALLKKEFDIHRAAGKPHPLMKKYGIDAIPLRHEKIEEWRDSMKRGVQVWHEPTGLIVRGGIDDVWVNPQGELIVVDYKATAKDEEVTLDKDWQISYKRQMEVYQWLFRQNGFKVADTGYFVYVNGRTDLEAFDGRLEFDVKIIPYKGDDSWVEGAILAAQKCLAAETIPAASKDCDYCRYVAARREAEE